jgi:competence protein ComEC
MNIIIRQLLLLFSVVITIFLIGCSKTKQEDKLEWISVNVCNPKPQGDAHIISKSGKTIVIDGGEYNQGKGNLLPLLHKKHISSIDKVIVSHPHYDHYGGIGALLEDKTIDVKELSMNMPTEEQMKREWWGGNYSNLVYLRKLATDRNITITPIKQGDTFYFDTQTYLKVLYVFDGINTPVGKTDINDMSAITMIYDGENRFLLTGDLNKKLGTWLANHAKDLHADILKIPHHSAEGLAPNSFFDLVDAKQFIITAPAYFWTPEFKRSQRVRKYVSDHHIPTYINGIHGHITVTSYDNKYDITVEKPN